MKKPLLRYGEVPQRPIHSQITCQTVSGGRIYAPQTFCTLFALFSYTTYKSYIMRNILICIAVLCCLTPYGAAAEERRIPYNDLPETARQFIADNLDRNKVIEVEQERDWKREYEVTFSDGSRIEFDDRGDWIKIKSSDSTFIRRFTPEKILRQTDSRYPGLMIVEIERHGRAYGIELADGSELLFDASGRRVKIDK